MKPPVLVTGATGFLGRALVPELVRAGHRVHALARPTSDRSGLDGLDVRWTEGELGDRASLERAVGAACEAAAGPPVVVHAAALISYRTRDRAAMRRANVDGTRNLLDACATRPVGRVLYVSSVVAVGVAPGAEAIDEDAPFNGRALGSGYMDTKREAEELALARADSLDVVAVNPGAIFGPGDLGSNTTRFLVKMARRGAPPLLPPGALAVVGMDDVVAGCLAAIGRGRRGRRYLLTESVLGLRELFALGARELGVRGPIGVLPKAVWGGVVAGARALDAILDLELLSPDSLRLLGERFDVSAARARAELGWDPRPFEEVLRATIVWLRREGHIS